MFVVVEDEVEEVTRHSAEPKQIWTKGFDISVVTWNVQEIYCRSF